VGLQEYREKQGQARPDSLSVVRIVKYEFSFSLLMKRPLIRQYVARAVIRRGDSFLLVRVVDEPHWFLPGGRVEPGESIRAAVVRELREELAVEVAIDSFIGCIEHAWSSGLDDWYETGFFFSVAVDLPDVVVSNESYLEFRWVTLADMNDLDIRPGPLKDLLHAVARGEHEPFWASTLERQ
jgi:8-oxo-dGTP pyrophosphatase MutT (NUDIX family)